MTHQTNSPELQDIFRKGIREILPAEQWPTLFPEDVSSDDLFLYVLKQSGLTFEFETACGLFLRSGLAGFKFLVRQHGKQIGIDNLEFRLQPPRQRLMDGLGRITGLMREWQPDEIITDQKGDDVSMVIRSTRTNLSESEARISQHFYAGLFQEYLYWAGGGKQYPFEVKPLEGEPAVRIQFRLLPVD